MARLSNATLRLRMMASVSTGVRCSQSTMKIQRMHAIVGARLRATGLETYEISSRSRAGALLHGFVDDFEAMAFENGACGWRLQEAKKIPRGLVLAGMHGQGSGIDHRLVRIGRERADDFDLAAG